MGEGRPTKRTPEAVAKIAEAVAIGLTDREAGILAGINPDTMTEWRRCRKKFAIEQFEHRMRFDIPFLAGRLRRNRLACAKPSHTFPEFR